MHNTYISSSFFSLRTNVSLSFSFNDVSNSLNEGFERNPFLSSHCCGGSCSSSCCCSCCSCCCCSCCGSSHANCRVHINPSLVYGLRQSRLIQRPPSRRLILSGRERYYCRVPSYGIDSCDYEVSCSFKERSDGGRVEKLGKENFGGGSSRGRRWFSGVDDVDAVISLLSEELSEEHLGGGRRNWGSVNRGDVEKVEKREGYGGGFRRGRKNGFRLELLDSDSKDESISVELRKEGYSRREEKEERKQYRKEGKEEEKADLGSANHRGRKGSSSFSSYYSVSSSGEFENDKEAQDVHGDFQEESSSEYRKELRSGAVRFEGNVEEEMSSHRESIEAEKEALEQKSSGTRTGVEWDMRKKTEKKLTNSEENQFREEHAQLESRMSRSHESDYRKASSSYKKIQEQAEKSSEFNVKKGARTRYSQVAENVQEQSDIRRNYQRVTDVQEIYRKNGKLTSQSQKQALSKEGNRSLEENLDASHKIGNEKAELGSRSQNLVDTMEIRNLDGGRMSQQQRWSESRMKLREEDRAVMPSPGRNEQHCKAPEQVSGLTETRRSSGKFSTVTDAIDSHSKKISISSSGIAVKDHQGSTGNVSTSGSELKAQNSSRDQRNVQMIQLSQESQDVTNISVNVANVSVVHGGHSETVKGSQRTTERRSNQGSEFSSIVKPIKQHRETDSADESFTRYQSANEGESAASVSGFFERSAQQATVAESSLNMVSQLCVQEIDIECEGERNRQPTLVTPSEGRTAASSQEPFGTDWNVDIHRKPSNLVSPKDALGSAQRLEGASAQFVGEYFEYEASTSKILKEKTLSDTKLEHESEKDRQNESGSEGIQLKEPDSRRSSRGSGVKGPSDEMWDTKDSSHQESPETKALEGVVANENTAARRSGKSLWNMIANIVTLRWHSHVETPKLVQKSGGKSSSNDSVSSDAWFSGNEPEENGNENAKERRSTPQEATSSDHLRRKQTPVKGKLDVADSMRQLRAGTSPSLVGLESKMASTGFLSPSDGKNLSRDEESRVVQVPPSPSQDEESRVIQVHPSDGKNLTQEEESRVVEISSLPLIMPTGVMSGGFLDEGRIKGETTASSSGSGTQTEQRVALKISDERLGSEGNEGELKQRRLQRNPQVPRDRFDAWEEAYILEREQRKVDEFFMKEALLEAKKAADTWEVPVGAVLVQRGNIIARGYNLVEELRDSTAHAEMICIREASNTLHSWRLAETTLYVTLEPCPMCAGAILQARIETLVWGAPNKLLGADGSWIRLFPDGGEGGSSEQSNTPAAPVHPFHPNITVRRGILASECADVMQQFFQLRRRKKVKEDDQPPQPSCLPIANRQSKILTKMHHIFHSLLCF